jgi:hypothetical protein
MELFQGPEKLQTIAVQEILKHLAKVSGREMAMSCGCGKQWV